MDFQDVPFYKDIEDPALSPLERAVIEALKSVYDPEIPVDIYELGLIYHIDCDTVAKKVIVYMTLTAPGCPVAGVMPDWVKEAIEKVDGVSDCMVEMVWDPPWTMEMMSLRAKIDLNMI